LRIENRKGEHRERLAQLVTDGFARVRIAEVFDLNRDLFAMLPEARAAGYQKSQFSFNVNGGRCEECRADGSIKVEMQFLADVYIPCQTCHGRQFNDATLDITFKGHSIAQVLY
jgi:excinuclease ABC subunit A